ncbi:hypothetical protein VTK73DRAFT_1564 [Phialemonium thermophilum]|uniref:Uncharacterized protein n=1 Tax=Phialemonium thermophilum TaxID=223376 RepID=A0ABR3VTC3_9PEZI
MPGLLVHQEHPSPKTDTTMSSRRKPILSTPPCQPPKAATAAPPKVTKRLLASALRLHLLQAAHALWRETHLDQLVQATQRQSSPGHRSVAAPPACGSRLSRTSSLFCIAERHLPIVSTPCLARHLRTGPVSHDDDDGDKENGNTESRAAPQKKSISYTTRNVAVSRLHCHMLPFPPVGVCSTLHVYVPCATQILARDFIFNWTLKRNMGGDTSGWGTSMHVICKLSGHRKVPCSGLVDGRRMSLGIFCGGHMSFRVFRQKEIPHASSSAQYIV